MVTSVVSRNKDVPVPERDEELKLIELAIVENMCEKIQKRTYVIMPASLVLLLSLVLYQAFVTPYDSVLLTSTTTTTTTTSTSNLMFTAWQLVSDLSPKRVAQSILLRWIAITTYYACWQEITSERPYDDQASSRHSARSVYARASAAGYSKRSSWTTSRTPIPK